MKRVCLLFALLFLVPVAADAQTQPTSFQAPAALDSGAGTIPLGVATGDFNGDGLLDFVVAEYNPSTPANGQIVFYLGNSDGSFTAQATIPINGTIAGQLYGPNHIISVGHFNGPGQPLGVAVALTTSPTCGAGGPGVYILYSMPTAAAGSISVCQPTSAAPTSVAVGDFNGDTFDDIAVSNPSGSAAGTMSVYFNVANASSGQSGFSLQGNFSATPINTSPSFQTLYGTLVAGNLNANGGPGLALLASTGPFTQYVDVFIPAQIKSGTQPIVWSFLQPNSAAPSPSNTFSDIAVAPANGSNLPSVIGISSQGAYATSVANTIPPLLGTSTLLAGGPLVNGFTLAVADFDGNGVPDFAFLNEHHSLGINLNPSATSSVVGPFGPAGQMVAAGFSTNLNRWVIIDAGVYQKTSPSFTLVPESRSIAVYIVDPTTGLPSLAPVFEQSSLLTNASSVPAFAVADLNGDGSPDVAVLGEDQASFAATITPFQNVFATNSAGFVAQAVTDLGGGTSITGPAPNGYAVVAGHFRSAANNPSGLPDLALYSSQGVTLVENLGAFQFALDTNCVGSFSSPSTNCYLGNDSHFPGLPSTLTAVPPIVVADVNGDGVDDLVMAVPENCSAFDAAGVRAAIYVFLSNGDGTFQVPVYYPSPVTNPVALAAGNVLNSGYPDIVVANGGEVCTTALTVPDAGAALAVLPNNHDKTGSFGTPTTLMAQLTPAAYPNISSVAIADMNLDGVPDIIASASDGLHVLLSPSATVASFADLGAVPLYGAPDAVIQNASQLTIADFNRDGAPDVGAVINGIAYIFQNNGTGGLSAPAQGYASGPDSTQAVGIDVNGDGAPDLLVSNSLGFTAMLSTTPAGIPVGSAAHLTISAGIISVGTSSTVAVSVTNSGPATATNVLVTYNIPAGLQFVQTGSASQCSASTATQVICTVGTLAAGTSSPALPIVVTSTVSQSASYLSTFTASSSQPEGVPASDATITIGVQVNGIPGPQLLTVSPSQGTQGQQALQLTLTGTNFQSAGAAVSFSNPGITLAGSLSVQNSTTAVVTINIAPTAATGPGNVTFTTAVGQSTLAGAFTVVALPPSPVAFTVLETIKVVDAPTFSAISDIVHVNDQVFITPLIVVAGPVAYFSAQSLGFGGSSGTQSVTLSNIGEGVLTLESVAAPSNPAFVISQVSCSNSNASFPSFPITLPAGAVCSFTITYTAPSGAAASGNIVFTDTSGLSNLTSTLSGPYFTQLLPLGGSGTTTAGGPTPLATVPVSVQEQINVTDTPTFAAYSETIHVVDTVSINIRAVTLQSITVTPPNPTIVSGTSQTFTATGLYTDGSTQNLTSSATWTSSNTGVATMSGATATGVGVGTATITATLGSISASTTLAVQAPAIHIAAQYKSIARLANGNYAVSIAVTNTGNIAAKNVTAFVGILGTLFNAKSMTRVTPAVNLAPGATGTVALVFPATSGRSGTRNVTFGAIGIATGTNPNGTAAPPALWSVYKTGLTLP